MTRSLESMIGRTMVSVVNDGDARLIFTTDDGEVFEFTHVQDCCEIVRIEDITGNLSDLIGSPILMAQESSVERGDPSPGEDPESWTWAFYKFATVKGYVDVRWVGESNGYYSERVDLIKRKTRSDDAD